jgi:hypothetical protein
VFFYFPENRRKTSLWGDFSPQNKILVNSINQDGQNFGERCPPPKGLAGKIWGQILIIEIREIWRKSDFFSRISSPVANFMV